MATGATTLCLRALIGMVGTHGSGWRGCWGLTPMSPQSARRVLGACRELTYNELQPLQRPFPGRGRIPGLQGCGGALGGYFSASHTHFPSAGLFWKMTGRRARVPLSGSEILQAMDPQRGEDLWPGPPRSQQQPLHRAPAGNSGSSACLWKLPARSLLGSPGAGLCAPWATLLPVVLG